MTADGKAPSPDASPRTTLPVDHVRRRGRLHAAVRGGRPRGPAHHPAPLPSDRPQRHRTVWRLCRRLRRRRGPRLFRLSVRARQRCGTRGARRVRNGVATRRNRVSARRRRRPQAAGADRRPHRARRRRTRNGAGRRNAARGGRRRREYRLAAAERSAAVGRRRQRRDLLAGAGAVRIRAPRLAHAEGADPADRSLPCNADAAGRAGRSGRGARQDRRGDDRPRAGAGEASGLLARGLGLPSRSDRRNRRRCRRRQDPSRERVLPASGDQRSRAHPERLPRAVRQHPALSRRTTSLEASRPRDRGRHGNAAAQARRIAWRVGRSQRVEHAHSCELARPRIDRAHDRIDRPDASPLQARPVRPDRRGLP